MKKQNKLVQQPKPNWTVISIIGALVALVIFGVALSNSTPDNSSLARCLSENGATMYGAYWCPHCADQKKLIGKEGFKEINYVECAVGGPKDVPANPKLCEEKQVSTYPTWIFSDGTKMTGTLTLDALAKKAGCTQFLQQ